MVMIIIISRYHTFLATWNPNDLTKFSLYLKIFQEGHIL